MGSLFPLPIKVQRTTLLLVEGIYTDDGNSEVNTQGSMQPFTGEVPEDLVNLRTAKGFLDVYCDDKLVVSTPGNASKLKGDIVEFDGGRWEVVKQLTHNQGIINHFRYMGSYIGEVTP